MMIFSYPPNNVHQVLNRIKGLWLVNVFLYSKSEYYYYKQQHNISLLEISNGNVAKTEYLVGGSVSNAPLNTTWTNYVMYYWPSESYTITQDLVITEQFADRYYTITFH